MTFAEASQPRFWKGTNDMAVLLSHGFTSTPSSVADWGEGLNKAGYTVDIPLLPGHGTVWQDLNKTRWEDWEKALLDAYDRLAATHRRVAVAGLSLGGALVMLVALKRPVAALLLVNNLVVLDNPLLPLAPVLRHLIPGTPAIAGDIKKTGAVEMAYATTPSGGADEMRQVMNVVKRGLPGITAPTLLFKSREDHVIPIRSTLLTQEKLGSARKELVWLEDSYHVATIDNDLPRIVAGSVGFLASL